MVTKKKPVEKDKLLRKEPNEKRPTSQDFGMSIAASYMLIKTSPKAVQNFTAHFGMHSKDTMAELIGAHSGLELINEKALGYIGEVYAYKLVKWHPGLLHDVIQDDFGNRGMYGEKAGRLGDWIDANVRKDISFAALVPQFAENYSTMCFCAFILAEREVFRALGYKEHKIGAIEEKNLRGLLKDFPNAKDTYEKAASYLEFADPLMHKYKQ